MGYLQVIDAMRSPPTLKKRRRKEEKRNQGICHHSQRKIPVEVAVNDSLESQGLVVGVVYLVMNETLVTIQMVPVLITQSHYTQQYCW